MLFCEMYANLLIHPRTNRHCYHTSGKPVMLGVENSNLNLGLIFLATIIFLLIFLGLMKGLIGMCCFPKVGFYGLHLLIDLPRPLNGYQEKNLEHRQVVYDVGGWPVHPDTRQRTVRALSKRTEFCLNVILFLACPIAGLVYICAFCCCIRNLGKSDENSCFKNVDVIKLTDHDCECNMGKHQKGSDGYKKDTKEDRDTRYVIDIMHESVESIHKFHCDEPCPCSNQ